MEVCHLWPFSFLKFGESFCFFWVRKWGLYFSLVLVSRGSFYSGNLSSALGNFLELFPWLPYFTIFLFLELCLFLERDRRYEIPELILCFLTCSVLFFYFSLPLISRHSFQLECYHICYCLWVLSFNGASVGSNSWTGQKLRLILLLVCGIISYFRFKTCLAILYSNITFALFSSSKSHLC